jgi:type IV pilus assembly protein PilN
MIRINLLPFRAARKKENIRRQVFIFFSLLVLIVLALLYYNMILGQKINTLQSDVDSTRAELNRAMKAAKEVDQIRSQIETLEKKMEIIAKLEKDRTAPVEFAEEMSRLVVAKRMWLISLQEDFESVKMGGFALDNKTVAVFMRNLESSPLFASVNLQQLQQVQRDQISLKTFSIECQKAGVEKPEPKGKKKSKKR